MNFNPIVLTGSLNIYNYYSTNVPLNYKEKYMFYLFTSFYVFSTSNPFAIILLIILQIFDIKLLCFAAGLEDTNDKPGIMKPLGKLIL